MAMVDVARDKPRFDRGVQASSPVSSTVLSAVGQNRAVHINRWSLIMKNLAGEIECDRQMGLELGYAGIPVVEATAYELRHSEVPFTVAGQLGPYRFRRAWYYWVVTGPVPLKIAIELYRDPVGRRDVRVVGHCACPPPEDPWLVYRRSLDGKQLVTREVWKQFEKFTIVDLTKVRDKTYEQCDDPKTEGEAYVESYHIDSEEGLKLFAQTVKRAGLA